MPKDETYQNPLVERYASREMAELFSARRRIRTWRQIWLALAEAEAELGLPITRKQLAELRRTIDDIDFKAAAAHEKRLRHDVMAHLHTWGDVAPNARGILHLGATSMDVVDNADLIIMRDALGLIRDWLVAVIDHLARFARQWRDLPCLGYTHYQPAQLTTVGRRACLWAYDFVRDLEEIEYRLENLQFRGIRGATGTQASFMALFNNDSRKVDRLERLVADKLGFALCEPVTGQTYTRKIDAQIAAALANIAAGAHKFANDIRLLAGMKEIEEPFESTQVGSSAMAYKRNPMRCERITGLARYVISTCSSLYQTAAEQWLERTLDDSSNKRITIPEMFLGTDAILKITANVASGLVVYPKVIESRVMAELPFMATEDILMLATAGGGKNGTASGRRGAAGKKKAATGDRQELHEIIRQHSQAAAREVKMHGRPNDLIERLAADPAFAGLDLKSALDPKRYVGRAPEQVDRFLANVVDPILRRLGKRAKKDISLHV
ncbi:MAG TPA: adenylosuccinate lyase [Phycisphaerae bacterium]|nr:adenylosuccinate lyase [Phycisphaerae bacterium]HOJ73313.1 adenylosuccinate lyase [Phycisphaerae bacterium]HOM51121.1 adenylosuccinate lyase [Phycisphaerae bacterium]HON66082.1 adenylosuccinate lyase [Phycisphaerae bacterium]HOQ86067.1 adenylosuccinate lyase [Phycisphaerae bacterium]